MSIGTTCYERDEINCEDEMCLRVGCRLRNERLSQSEVLSVDDWREDPGSDERWNAGVDFALEQLGKYLGVDLASITWDGATETVEGDVDAVIGHILCEKFGEDWGPKDAAQASWMPIATCPHNEAILVRGGGLLYPVVANWSGRSDESWWLDGEGDVHVELDHIPTHWMDLDALEALAIPSAQSRTPVGDRSAGDALTGYKSGDGK